MCAQYPIDQQANEHTSLWCILQTHCQRFYAYDMKTLINRRYCHVDFKTTWETVHDSSSGRIIIAT